MPEYVQLGIGLAIAVSAIFASNKNVKIMIKNAIDPITETLKMNTKSLETLNRDYEFTNSVTVFFKKVGIIFERAISVLSDTDKAHLFGEIYPPAEYLICFEELFEELIHTVLMKGIDDIGDEQFKAVAILKMLGCKEKMGELFGSEFTELYFNKHDVKREKYIQDVCDISRDWINSHNERYTNITLVFLQDQTNNFVRFYFNNKNLIKN